MDTGTMTSMGKDRITMALLTNALVLAVLCAALLAGCADNESGADATPAVAPTPVVTLPYAGPSGSVAPGATGPSDATGSGVVAAPTPSGVVYGPAFGAPSLNEVVYNATVIARVKLKSAKASAEHAQTLHDGSSLYQGLVEFTFEVKEYLKGTGGDQLVAVANVDLKSDEIQEVMDTNARGEFVDWYSVDLTNPYTSMALALEAAKKWKDERVTTWDDREAIILLKQEAVPGSSDGSKRLWLGYIYLYALDTGMKAWLPSATSAQGAAVPGQGASETRYLLEPPKDSASAPPRTAPGAANTGVSPSTEQAETTSVSELKSLIAKLERWRKDGEGVEGFAKCVKESFLDASYVNGRLERGESTYVSFDYSMASGLPEKSDVHTGAELAGKTWLDGNDKDLFEIAPSGNYDFRTTRPLPKGTYSFYGNLQRYEYIPCDYIPDDASNTIEHFVHVTAHDGVLHEAFFDPAAIDAAVGVDATKGALEPAAFTNASGVAVTIERIAWESQQVTIEVSPSSVPADHHVDFIALDGSVSLRLDVDDATKSVDGGTTTLAWTVCAQPWKTGDKLMLRISRSPADLAGATNDSPCDGSTPTPTPPEARPPTP